MLERVQEQAGFDVRIQGLHLQLIGSGVSRCVTFMNRRHIFAGVVGALCQVVIDDRLILR
jgi:hypothetical protein